MAQTGEPPPLKPMIYKIIRKMTEVSQVKLQPELAEFLVLRNVVKTSRRSIAEVVATLFDIMHSNCPLRRHATLLLIDYLFKRSHHLRLEVVERIQEFYSLVCESDPLHQPLPPPKNAADALKTAGIKIVKAWHEKYGIAYSELDLVSSHLKASKSVDFDRATAELLSSEATKQPHEVPKYLLDSIAASEAAEQQSRRKFDPPGSSPFVHSTANVAGKSAIPTVPYGLDLRPKRECRYPIDNGELCPRRDHKMCPIHGPILDRDKHGIVWPVSPTYSPFSSDDDDRATEHHSDDDEITVIWEQLGPKKECRFRMENGKVCHLRAVTTCPVHGFTYNRDTEGTRTDYWPTSPTYSPFSCSSGDGDEERDIDGVIGTSLSEKSKRPKKKEPKGLSGTALRERLQAKLFPKSAIKKVRQTPVSQQADKIKKKYAKYR